MTTPPARAAGDPSGWTAAAVFIALAVFVPAGGLGAALAVGLGGLTILALWSWGWIRGQGPGLRWPRPGETMALAFFLWAATSAVWSVNRDPSAVITFTLTVPLYVIFVVHVFHLDGAGRRRAQAALVLCCLASATFFVFELLTGGIITTLNGRVNRPHGEVLRNLGHGVSTLVALAPPAIAVLWRAGVLGRASAVGVAAIVLAGGIGFGLTSNAVGVLAAALFAALTLWAARRERPRTGLKATAVFAAGVLALSPLLALLVLTPAETRAAIPTSWDRRIDMWAYTVNALEDRPVFGYGFDAARKARDEVVVDGQARRIMKMHPHNAGLQAGYETGLIGLILFVAAVGRLLWRAAPRWPRTEAATLAAVSAAMAAMGALSYGLWQEWWLATGFGALAACGLAGAQRMEPRP